MAARDNHQRTHGMRYSPEYKSWDGMRRRCLNSNHKYFKHYGGRGITVCERWSSFVNFFADMGVKPSPKHGIERIDNDGNYEPGNCRWATTAEQNANRANRREFAFDGKSLSLPEWARAQGIPLGTLKSAIYKGKNRLAEVLSRGI